MNFKKILFCAFILSTLSCVGESYKVYSTKYMVRFSFDSGVSPYNQVTSPGVFISVMQSGGQIKVTSAEGKVTKLPMSDVDARTFCFGLSGLIIGTPVMDNDDWHIYAYDLGCPVCDKSTRHLTFNSLGVAECASCGTTFDLNNNGYVLHSDVKDARPLLRYPVSVAGRNVSVCN